MKYDPHLIEKKWQKFWKEKKTFKAIEDPQKPKYYVLDMFPYPSGAGLHVGHLVGYTATDVLARYKRALGFCVLHPMGWDSFGLPAEQYAVRTGTHPAITTRANIKKFKEQMQAVGYAYDWDREIQTSEPKYYKWTQWIFTKLYEKGLAYEADVLVNWCPALTTVLANEEIEAGRSKEGGHPVHRKPLRQWVLKITAYAERLLDDLELLDWPEGLKKLQKNWIGKSEGASIDFEIEGHKEKVTVFTTCPHTLFGVTYMVLAPEHPLVDKILIPSQKEAVFNYRKISSEKTDLERTELSQNKTGAFTGAYAINPANGNKIPIWIADYVLMGYGTGAIMSVPAHDARDLEFAKAYNLPVVEVIDSEDKCINSFSTELNINGLDIDAAKEKVIEWLIRKELGKSTINYKLRDWLFSRQRYWGEPIPVLHFEDGSKRILELDELPLIPPEVTEYKPASTGESPLAKVSDWVEVEDPKTGKMAKRETNTMPQWAGSCWYYLRFCDPQNSENAWDFAKEKYWMPVDMYVGGAEHAVLHLLYARFWHKVLYDLDLVSTLEPFQKLVNQGLVVSRSYQKAGGHYVASNDVVEREDKFFHWETGEELKSQVEKMSKSKLNGVSPDEIIEEFGADALRLYSLFMGPIEKEKIWNTDSVSGCKRFLNRFYELCTCPRVQEVESEEATRLVTKLIHGVSDDLDKMLFNTAIAKMMEFINEFSKLTIYSREALKKAVKVLAPFAPHIAEELWMALGETSSVSEAPWPVYDPKFLEEETATYVVQVNGKLRGKFELPKDQDEKKIVELAKSDPHISKFIKGEVMKVVFVPNKLLNFVVK